METENYMTQSRQTSIDQNQALQERLRPDRNRLISFLKSYWTLFLPVLILLTIIPQIIWLAIYFIQAIGESANIWGLLLSVARFIIECVIDLYLITNLIKGIKYARSGELRPRYFEKLSELFRFLNKWIKFVGVVGFFYAIFILFSGRSSVLLIILIFVIALYILLQIAFYQSLADFCKEIYSDLTRSDGVIGTAKILVRIFSIQFVLSLSLSLYLLTSDFIALELGGSVVQISAILYAASTLMNLYGIIYLLKFQSWPKPTNETK